MYFYLLVAGGIIAVVFISVLLIGDRRDAVRKAEAEKLQNSIQTPQDGSWQQQPPLEFGAPRPVIDYKGWLGVYRTVRTFIGCFVLFLLGVVCAYPHMNKIVALMLSLLASAASLAVLTALRRARG